MYAVPVGSELDVEDTSASQSQHFGPRVATVTRTIKRTAEAAIRCEASKDNIGSVVETAASNTSPPGGPSKDQFPFPAGRIARVFRGCSGRNELPGARFPCSSSRRTGPGLDAKSFLEDTAEELLCPACGEPIRAANVLDIAPILASRTQPLSNMPRNPSNRRELELKRLEIEGLFIVRFSY